MLVKLSLSAGLVLSISCQCCGAMLLSWNTFGNAGTESSEPSVTNFANIAPADLTRGAGISNSGNENRFGGSSWFDTGNTIAGSTVAEAVAGNHYLEFIVIPTGGATFSATSFNFMWDRSGTGPSAVTLRSSLDAFTADLGSVTGLVSSVTNNTIAITGVTDVAIATSFRLYGFGATSGAGTGGFDTTTNSANVIFNGTVTAVPEPSSLALLVAAAAAGGAIRQFRRHAKSKLLSSQKAWPGRNRPIEESCCESEPIRTGMD